MSSMFAEAFLERQAAADILNPGGKGRVLCTSRTKGTSQNKAALYGLARNRQHDK